MTATIFLPGVIVGLAKHSEMIDGVRVMGAMCPEEILAHIPRDVASCDRMNEAGTMAITRERFVNLNLTKEEVNKGVFLTWTLATAPKTVDYNNAGNWNKTALRFQGNLANVPFESLVFWSTEKQAAVVAKDREELARKNTINELEVKNAFVQQNKKNLLVTPVPNTCLRSMVQDTQLNASFLFSPRTTLDRTYGKNSTVAQTYVDPFGVEYELSLTKPEFDPQIEELRKNPMVFGIEIVRTGIKIYTNMMVVDLGTGFIELGKLALVLNVDKQLEVTSVLTDNPNLIEVKRFQPVANLAYAAIEKAKDQSIFESKTHMAWRASSPGFVELVATGSSVTFGPYSGKIYSRITQGDIKTAVESMLQILVLNNPAIDLPSFGYKHKT